MRSLASILASAVVALGLAVGLLALESQGAGRGAGLGATVIAAALAAFLLTYDVLKREELAGAKPDGSNEPRKGGRSPVRPIFDPEDALYIDAVARGGIAHMNDALKDRRRDVVYVFRIKLQARKYDTQVLTEQLAILSEQISPKSFVYFVKPDDSFVCFAEAETVLSLFKDPKSAGLIKLINDGFDEEIRRSYSELSDFTISRKSSSGDALGAMALRDRTIAMIVHEKHGRPIGPIDWATLATRVLRMKS